MGAIQEFIQFCEDIEHLDDHKEWSVSWEEVRRGAGSLDLRVSIERTHDDESGKRSWMIQVADVREVVLKQANDTGRYPPYTQASLLDDHVLLWGHVEPVSQLSIFGPPESHEALLCDLNDRHYALAGDWIPFFRYINGYFVGNRLSGRSGVLANGPDRLLREYAAVFDGSDIEAYFPYPPRAPVRWVEDRGWVQQDKNLRVLILDNSYVIGAGFKAERLD